VRKEAPCHRRAIAIAEERTINYWHDAEATGQWDVLLEKSAPLGTGSLGGQPVHLILFDFK